MRSRIAVLLLVAAISAGPASAQTYQFEVIDFPGALRTEAYGINDAGHIVGYYAAYDGLHGFLLDGTGLKTINVPPGPNTTAFGINDLDQIVGKSGGPDSFLLDGTTVTAIRYPGLLPDPTTIALGINDAGHVVGRYIDADTQGFLLVEGTFTKITPPGSVLTEATGINDSGQIVGTYIEGGVNRSFLRIGSTFQEVAVPAATLTEVHGINSTGEMAGTFIGPDNVAHGFVYSEGKFSPLDVPGAIGPNYTQAKGINDVGQVVGWFNDAAGTHAFLATPLSASRLESLVLKSSQIAGCKSVTGTVTLTGAAPPEGVVVTLSDTLASATAPAKLTIPSGAVSKTFTVKTEPVAVIETGTVSATLDDKTLSQDLTVRPMGLTSVTLSPTTVVGGKPSTGTAKLECKAGPGPITVDLASSKPSVADPAAASISVPQGLQSATFDTSTNAVLAKTTATISGTANEITKSKVLTVTPAAVVAPTSLKFGSMAVGTTSGPLNATLTNKGAVPFSVTGISLTGTYASWFALTNDCPASLPAGASCTISVTFTPQAAASKSAKLTIATSATSTPLSVSLSGTGM